MPTSAYEGLLFFFFTFLAAPGKTHALPGPHSMYSPGKGAKARANARPKAAVALAAACD